MLKLMLTALSAAQEDYSPKRFDIFAHNTLKLGCTDTTFLQTDTSTSIFICVLADTEYRYRYFLDLVSMKVQFIWRQILFYLLQIMSSLLYKIKRGLSQAKNKQSFLVLTHKKSLQTDNIITLDKMQI